jgi:hypothetical protein
MEVRRSDAYVARMFGLGSDTKSREPLSRFIKARWDYGGS